jgi:hypothetical protein
MEVHGKRHAKHSGYRENILQTGLNVLREMLTCPKTTCLPSSHGQGTVEI